MSAADDFLNDAESSLPKDSGAGGTSGSAADFLNKIESQTDHSAPAKDASASAPLNLARIAAQFGRGVIEGTAGMAGLPGFLGEKIDALTGQKPPNGSFWSTFGPGVSLPIPDPQTITGAAEKLGIYDPKNVPRNGAESVAEFLGAEAPSMAVGAASGMPLLSNAFYSTVPGVIADKFSSYVPPWISAPLLALAGSRFGTGINALNAMRADTATAGEAGTALENAQSENALAVQNRASSTAAFQQHQQENHDFREAQQNEKNTVKETAEAQKNTNIADATKAHGDAHLGADNAREEIASRLGSSVEMNQANNVMKTNAQDWMDNEFKGKIKAAEDQLGVIPQDARGPMDNFKNVLHNSNYNAGEAEPIAQLFQSNLPARLRNAVDQLGFKQMTPEQLIENGPAKTPDLAFGDMRKLRSVLGDALKDPKTVRDVGAGRLNEMYGALSDDMRNLISENVGPTGIEAFDKFNNEAGRLYRLASGPVNDVINGGADVVKMKPDQLAAMGVEPRLKDGINEVAAANLRKGLPLGDQGVDPEKEFMKMPSAMRTQLYGDVNSGHIQDVIDSRVEADKSLKEATSQAEEQAKNTKEMTSQRQRQESIEQGRAGTLLSQAASNASRRENVSVNAVRDAARNKAALDAKVRENQNNSLTNIKNWKVPGLGALGGLGGASLLGEGLGSMAHNALSGLPISDIPDIGLAGTAGIAGALGASGVKQLWRYPGETSRNMLMGTVPATSTQPNK